MARSKLTSVVMRVIATICLVTPAFAAGVGGKPEKPDVIVTYAQPSGAFTPIWVAYEAGLFKKHGLNATLQLLTPQVSAQAVVSEEADFYTDGPDLINARLRPIASNHAGKWVGLGMVLYQLGIPGASKVRRAIAATGWNPSIYVNLWDVITMVAGAARS